MDKKTPFEDFLKEWHAKDYHGTDDDMSDAFDEWLGNLDGEDYINLGDIACRESELRGMDKMAKRSIEIIRGE